MNLIILKTLLLFFILTNCIAQVHEYKISLMPVPADYEFTSGKFRLNESFSVSLNSTENGRTYKAARRMLHRLTGSTGLFLSNPFVLVNDKNADMIIDQNRVGEVKLGEDESYNLIITKDKIHISAETDLGAIRGIETFLQLLDADDEGYFFHTIHVKDNPRFPWRGLMIDACRHFMPVDVIKRNLDGMAAVKLNVMHWHLSEDQGFRIECKTFPKLHELGSDGDYYTREQIKDIIKYADDRGIRVMPEFDIPGHATSWLTAYPEFASLPGPYTIERNWGIFDPTLNPVIEKTYEFLDGFFKEMSELFPDEYMHIGGDENNGIQWDSNPDIQEFIRANNIPDNHALQSYFNTRLLNILTNYNKKMIGWDEIFHPDLPKNIVIHSWRGKESLVEAARLGFQGILSKDYYIDLNQSTVHHYLNDPLPEDTPLNEQEQKLVLGGEATMWAEFVSPENVDSRIWPRTAAIAERFWSPGSVKDTLDMYKRLDQTSFRLEELGLLHIKNYDMMLRRLTKNEDITPLKNFVDVIEPVKIYRRNQLRKHTQQSPLTRVVDASRPDAKVAREFRYYIDQFLSGDKSKIDEIKTMLILWRDNHNNLKKIIQKSPVLKEIESASEDLSGISGAGLESIEHILNNRKQNQEWIISKLEIIEKAKVPRGQAEIMVVESIEKLIKRSGE